MITTVKFRSLIPCLFALVLLFGGCKEVKENPVYYSYEEALALAVIPGPNVILKGYNVAPSETVEVIEIIGTTNGVFTSHVPVVGVSTGHPGTSKYEWKSQGKMIQWERPQDKQGIFRIFRFLNQDNAPLMIVTWINMEKTEDEND